MDWRVILDKFVDDSSFEGGVLLKGGQQLLGALRKHELDGVYVISAQPRDKMGDVIPDAPVVETYFSSEDVVVFQRLERDSGLIKPKLNLNLKYR